MWWCGLITAWCWLSTSTMDSDVRINCSHAAAPNEKWEIIHMAIATNRTEVTLLPQSLQLLWQQEDSGWLYRLSIWLWPWLRNSWYVWGLNQCNGIWYHLSKNGTLCCVGVQTLLQFDKRCTSYKLWQVHKEETMLPIEPASVWVIDFNMVQTWEANETVWAAGSSSIVVTIQRQTHLRHFPDSFHWIPQRW